MRARLLRKLRKQFAANYYIRKRPDSDRCDLYFKGKCLLFYDPEDKIRKYLQEKCHDYMMSYISVRKNNVYIW